MAPELIQAKEDRQYTKKVDIWSLGIFAIELAQSLPPYINEEPTRALFNIIEKTPPSISSKWSTLFQDFIDKCLEKDPMKRWSAEALIEHPFLEDASLSRDEWIYEFSRWKSQKFGQIQDPSSESTQSKDDLQDQGLIPETGIPKTPNSSDKSFELAQKAETFI